MDHHFATRAPLGAASGCIIGCIGCIMVQLASAARSCDWIAQLGGQACSPDARRCLWRCIIMHRVAAAARFVGGKA